MRSVSVPIEQPNRFSQNVDANQTVLNLYWNRTMFNCFCRKDVHVEDFEF